MKFEATDPDQTYDCEALISASLVEKLMQAVDFPATVDIIAEDSPPAEATAVLAAESTAELAPDTQAPQPELPASDIEGLMEDVVTPSSKALADATPDSEAWRKATIKSLRITVLRAPEIRLALPVQAEKITLNISAKVQLSVRLMGRWRSISVSVRDAQVRNQQARLQMSFEQGKLKILPQFETLQMQLPLRLLKWKFTYNLDIAQPVNRHLSANDFATELPSVYFGVPITGHDGLHLSLADLEFKPHAQGLLLCSKFAVGRG